MTEEDVKKMKQDVDREIGIFLDSKIAEAQSKKLPAEFFQKVENLRSFVLRGGKRLRPFLFYYGYSLSGGKKKKEAIKTAVALEFLHAGLLIHDDVMDKDDIRHGGPSMHFKYEKDYSSILKKQDLQHFGYSMAICAGDIALSWSYEILSKSNFDAELKIKALSKLSEILTETSVGQMLDEILQFNDKFDEELIYNVHDYKTARYSVSGPLQLGAILAGADRKELHAVAGFSIPLGVAYQIKDDVMGLFGDQQKMGKPVGSDIREGKKTLLISYALQHTNREDRKLILANLGNEDLKPKDFEKIKRIIEDCGALKYSDQRIDELSQEFFNKLRNKKDRYSQKYIALEDFVHYLLKREN